MHKFPRTTIGGLSVSRMVIGSNHSGVHPFVNNDYRELPVRPSVLGEGAYENGPEYLTGPITPFVARRQAYWSFMAGGFHTYGNNYIWKMEASWKESLDSPGAMHISIFKKIITSREWWKLVPDQSMFIRGVNGGDTLNAAMRSIEGDCIIAYISSRTCVTIELGYISSAVTVVATWIDPTSGEKLEGGKYSNRSKASFATPTGWEDAVLILEGAANK